MASDPITSRQTEGEKVEAVTDFIFLDSKITAGDDCSLEIKRCLLLGRKTMTNPLTVWITTNCGKPSRDENTRLPYLPPKKSVCSSRSNS